MGCLKYLGGVLCILLCLGIEISNIVFRWFWMCGKNIRLLTHAIPIVGIIYSILIVVDTRLSKGMKVKMRILISLSQGMLLLIELALNVLNFVLDVFTIREGRGDCAGEYRLHGLAISCFVLSTILFCSSFVFLRYYLKTKPLAITRQNFMRRMEMIEEGRFDMMSRKKCNNR